MRCISCGEEVNRKGRLCRECFERRNLHKIEAIVNTRNSRIKKEVKPWKSLKDWNKSNKSIIIH